MPRKSCPSCSSSARAEIDAALRAGIPHAKIAVEFKVGIKTLRYHNDNHVKNTIVVPSPPPIPEGASPLDAAKAHAGWIKARIDGCDSSGMTQKEITALAAQYTQAMRLVARLSGALEVTEAQILRSAPWSRIMSTVRESLKNYPQALEAVATGLENLDNIRSPN